MTGWQSEQTIYYAPRLKSCSEFKQGIYKYNPKKRMRFLQRLCLWILDKLGCHYYDEYVVIETVTINPNSIVDLIMNQSGMIQSVFGDCKYLILGREQMRQLHIDCLESQLGFVIPWDYGVKEFAGLSVIFVPWFDGIVCLSDLDVMAVTQ